MDYCASNPNTVKLYRACDMILIIHSNNACLVKPEARSCTGGLIYLCNKYGQQMNEYILILAKIIKNVVLSASEAEISAPIMNTRLAVPFA